LGVILYDKYTPVGILKSTTKTAYYDVDAVAFALVNKIDIQYLESKLQTSGPH